MVVLVQHLQSRHFLRADGTWTPCTGDAHDFESSLNALFNPRRDEPFQIVLKFTDSRYDIVLPPVSGSLSSTRRR